MKILALVTGPFYEDQIHGGSYRILRSVLSALAADGHTVTLLCGRGPKDHPPFQAEGVAVKPILKLKRLFPNPWSVKLPDLLDTYSLLSEAVVDADVLYNHDSQFLWCLHALGRTHRRRLVCSLRDFVYEDSLRGLFSMNVADCVIANSAYAFDVIRYIDRTFHLGIDRSLVCVENGVNLEYWQTPEPSSIVFNALKVVQADALLLIAPVRPEINKGTFEALAVLNLCLQAGIDAHLAICEYVDEGFPSMAAYQERLAAWRKEYPLAAAHLHILPWLRSDDLRALYQRATVTLCLGTFPEGFGSNVYVESVSAGTPCVTTIAGAMATTFPRSLSFQVSPGAADEAFRHIVSIISMTPDTLCSWRARTAEYIRNRYSISKMTFDYVRAITGTAPSPPHCDNAVLERPPWQIVAPNGELYDAFNEYFVGRCNDTQENRH